MFDSYEAELVRRIKINPTVLVFKWMNQQILLDWLFCLYMCVTSFEPLQQKDLLVLFA